jgi:autotransporter-associated beta strand protein
MKYFFTFLFLSFNFVFYSQNIKISEQDSKNQNDNFYLNKDANQAILYAYEDIEVSSKIIEKYLDQGFEVILKTKKNIEISAPIFYERNQKGILKFISEDTGTIQMTNLAKIVSTKSRLDFIIKTQGNIKINPSTHIQTNGGDIQLQAFENTTKLKRNPTNTIEVYGTIEASGVRGGKITIESDKIQLYSQSKVLSKGTFGGGKILIGGDWQGGAVPKMKESEAIYEAIVVNVEKGALIDASATQKGNGGKVVVWSNLNHPRSNTFVQGDLLAMGGKISGKGGKIETSGGAIDFEKINVSTIAADGSAGEWLIDPWNFFFNSTHLNSLASNLANSNISISTGNNSAWGSPNTFFGRGYIVFENNFSYLSSNARTLTLNSNADIWIKGNISSSSGALSLSFNAPSNRSIYINGDINTNGGNISVFNNSMVHFQKTSGSQSINTNNGAVSFGSSNIRLLRHDGTLTINTGAGGLELGGSGSIEQVNTYFDVSSPTTLFTWGGAHTVWDNVNGGANSGLRSYGSNNIVMGREYALKLWFWDSWDGEGGEVIVREPNNAVQYYFRGFRTQNAGITSHDGFSRSVYQINPESSQGRSNWNDQNVEIYFQAQHNGTLQTYTSLNQDQNDESLEIQDFIEISFPSSSFTIGSRSLELVSTSGQILCGTKNFIGLANLTFNTNNNDGFVDGIISGTTNVTKSGSGRVRFSGRNTYSGTTTVIAGTYRFVPWFTGDVALSGAFTNNGTVTYETGNVNNRPTIYLDGGISGSGTWNISSDVAPANNWSNRLSFRSSTTTTGQINISSHGNLWFEGSNINTTSPIFLDGANARLRLYGPLNASMSTGAITGTGTVDFADGGGGKNLTLSINTGANNAQFNGFFSNTGTSLGPTVLNLRKDGTGTYILTGNNTYSGTTLVNGGVLQIGNGGATGRLGSGAVTIASNCTLNFNLNTTTSFSNGFNYSAAGATIANTSSTSSAMITLSGGVNAGTFGSSILDGGAAGITVSGAATPPAPGAGVWIKGDVTFTGNDLNSLVILSVGTGSTMRFKTTATLWFFGSTTAANAPNIVVDPSITISQNTSQGAGNLFYNNLSGSGTISLAGSGATHSILGESSVGNLNATSNIALIVGQGGTTGSIVSGNITANNGITLNSTSSYSFSGILAGTTLTKQNTNTVTLTGTNTYSGTTTISGGNLQIGNNGTTGSIGSGNVINNGNLVFRRSDNLFFNNIISGTGIVIKESSGRVNLMSANTYSGGTTVSSGTLAIYNATSLGTGNVSLASSTSLLSGRGVATLANNIILNGNANIGLDNEVEVLLVGGGGGASSGGGGGGGVVSQTVTASSGTYSVLVGLGGAGGTPSHVGTNGANGENTTFNGVTAFGGGGGARAMSAGLPGASGGGAGGDCTLSGGSATQGFPGGTGPSALSGTGASGGGGAGGAGVSGFTQVAYNTLYGLSGQNTMGGNGGIGTINSITGTSVYYGGGGGGGCNNNNLLQAVERAGQGGLGGGGRGANGDRINGVNGTANTGGGGGGGDWEATIGGNGGSGIAIIRYRGGSSATGGTITSGTGIAAGYTLHTFTNSGNNSFTLNGSAVNLTGVISGSGNITFQSNDGTISLSGNNTYTGNTIISSGTLILNTSGTIDSGNYSGNISNSGIFRIRSNTEHLFSGIISGTGELIKETSTSILKLTGTNTYSGTTTISSGTIQIGDSTTTGIFGTGNIVNNSAILVKRSNDLTMSNLISGTGTLTKENSNVLTLTQNNTYSGNNTINGGTLVLQNNAPNPTNKTFNGNGKLRIEPASASFTSGYSTLGYTFNSSLSELTLGKVGNLSTITSAIVTTISGPVTIFGGTIAINENISSSNGGTISIFGNGLTFGSGKSVSSSGQLIVAPQTASTTIGIGGATGTLSLPASFFSINFADGFSNIQIGSSTQTGNISVNTFSLKDDISLLTSGSLTLGGKPELGSNHVTLGTGITTINVGSPANYFQTNGSGTVIRRIANNSNLLFPVGNSAYNPISINNKTGIIDTFSISVLDTAYLDGSNGGIVSNSHVKRTWNISKNSASANAGSGVDLSFTWNANEVVGTLPNPTLNHHNGSGWEIPTMGTSSVSGTTLTYTGYKGTFSPFAIGGSSIFALPVELKEFKATCQSDYIQIEWTTASEIKNKAFELFKSDDAKDWKLIHTTEGQGTKATETQYSFKDLDKKESYYRLKDIDEDGVENWSQIIFADCKNDVSGIQIYPNPASDFIKVIIPFEENTTLNILSMEGKTLKSMPSVSKNNLIHIKDLANGVYIIEIKNQKQIEQIKFLKK